MKLTILALLIALFPAAAQEPASLSRTIAVSPDRQYEVVVAEGAWLVRNTHSQEVLASPEIDPPYTPTSGGTALWSPDSHKVVFAYRIYKNGGDDYFAFAIDGAKLVLLHLPDDAIPIRWTAANTLIFSVRTEAPLTLDPKTGTFGRATSAPSGQ